MTRRTARGNHYGLFLTGLILLVGGLLALARGLDWLTEISFFGPASANSSLLSPTETSYAKSHAWFWYVVAAIAVVVALWALRWILVQLRSERIRSFQLERDRRRGTTTLPSAALTDAVEDEVASYRGVHRAHARLTNKPNRPRLRLTVSAEHDVDLGDLRRRIQAEAVPHARAALDRDELPTLLTFRLDTAKARRRTL
jgi:hypothetical protein